MTETSTALIRSLPLSYEDWPNEAKQSYQSMKKRASNLHQYIDVTPQIMDRVQRLCRRAEEVDAGNGHAFDRAFEIMHREYMTEGRKR